MTKASPDSRISEAALAASENASPRAPGAGPPPGLSVEEFGSIVGGIYECVLDPTGWPAVLERVREAVCGAAAWIAVHHPRQVRSVYEIEVGTNPVWQRRLRESYVPMSPFISVPHHAKAGAIFSVDDVVDYQEFVEGRFYREWAGPQGWVDLIMAVLTAAPDRFAWLGFCLRERARDEQKASVAAFRPHVERALRISDLLELRTAQAADLTAALEGLSTGMILVAADLTVRGINPAAERLMRETGGLSAASGRLSGPGGEAGAELRVAVAACAESRLDRAGASMLFSDKDGGLGLLAHVLPLIRPRAPRAGEAVAAIFLTNPTAPRHAPMDVFVKRFALTPSETRVLLAIMEGKSPRAIAAAQGTGLPTVRTHLSRLYDKTGTRGQTDIVRLMASVSTAI